MDISVIPNLQRKQMELQDSHRLIQDHMASKAKVKTQGN